MSQSTPTASSSSKAASLSLSSLTPSFSTLSHHTTGDNQRRHAEIQSIQKIKVEENTEAFEFHVKQMKNTERRRRDQGREFINPDKVTYQYAFHACAKEAVENICANGFNRSYSGKNATAYGAGSYFARDASYSTKHLYSPKDNEGCKRMFLCTIAIGAHTPVRIGYNGREPPVRDEDPLHGVGKRLYDCTTNCHPQDKGNGHPWRVVDGIPDIIVVWKDSGAIPNYLITFKGDGPFW